MAKWIVPIWCAGVALKVLAACRIAAMRRISRYWAVFLYLAACAAHSAVRLYLIHGYPATRALHRAFRDRSEPLILALMGVAILSAFRINTEKYPNFRIAGTAILSVLVVLGTAASWASRSAMVPPGWSGAIQGSILLERNVLLAMAVVLAGTVGIVSWLKALPVRPSARTAAYLLCLEVGWEFAVTAFAVATNHRFKMIDGLAPVIGGLIYGGFWALYFPRVSDRCGEVETPAPGEYATLALRRQQILATLPLIRRALLRF